MYIRTSSFVSFETTFYIACIQQGFVDPKCNRGDDHLPPPRSSANMSYGLAYWYDILPQTQKLSELISTYGE